MLIRVTAEDIQQGERYHTLNCPVAIALRRHLGDPTEFVDYRKDLSGYCCSRGPLPNSLTPTVDAYDRTGVMRPFEFELQTSE